MQQKTPIQNELDVILWGDMAVEMSFPKIRPLLAHYTSLEVFEKILLHNEMWFSNPLYMNDWEELQYGMNLGAGEFRTSDHLADACDDPDIHRKLINYFDKLFTEFDTSHAINTYVLCFSEHNPENNDGVLSMWRGYGARGGGVALIFDTSELGAIENSPLLLGRVHYASHPQRLQWIDKRLSDLALILKAHPQTDANLFYIAHAWIERLKVFSLFTKHDGFTEEREWRVVYMSERDSSQALASMMGYLLTPRGVEPKLKLKLTEVNGVTDATVTLEKLLNRIILGPSISTVLAENAFKKMLHLREKSELAVLVTASSIPFRA